MTAYGLAVQARDFAIDRHDGQTYGALPYRTHLLDVVNVLRDAGLDDEYMIASAWLHDVIEDTHVTMADIDHRFGRVVAEIVNAVSGEGANRAARNASIYRKVNGLFGTLIFDAANVKVADRIANVEHSKPGSKHREMYRGEREAFHLNVAQLAERQLINRLHAAYDKE